MGKFKILVADDERSGQEEIEKYIEHYFKDLNNVEIAEESFVSRAIMKIQNEDPFDFIFADLDFDYDEFNKEGEKLNGKHIILASVEKVGKQRTRFFTVSGKTGKKKINRFLWDLEDVEIEFESLIKDEPLSRVERKIDTQLKKWTEQVLSVGIRKNDKKVFFNLVDKRDFEEKINVFKTKKHLKTILIYWLNKGITPTRKDILTLFPNSLLDLPNISTNKLFKVGKNGLQKIEYPLVDYYKAFWEKEKGVEYIKERAEKYLDRLIYVYSLSNTFERLQYDAMFDSDFETEFYILWEDLYSEKIKASGGLGSPTDGDVFAQFIKRLWVRLFCVGAYFLCISWDEIFRLIGGSKIFIEKKNGRVLKAPDDSNYKIFTRSLWLEGFRQSMAHLERNNKGILDSLCDYEREIIKDWWFRNKTENSPEFQEVYETRKLKYIEDSLSW